MHASKLEYVLNYFVNPFCPQEIYGVALAGRSSLVEEVSNVDAIGTDDAQFDKSLEAYSHVNLYTSITIASYAALFLVNCLSKHFRWTWLKLLSWAVYVSIPTPVSYTIGLMAPPEAGRQYPYGYIFMTTIVLFGYSGLDNLICFSLQERNDRTILFFQFIIKVILLFRYTRISAGYVKDFGGGIAAVLLFVFMIVCFKLMERIAALAHAAGATAGIRENLRRIFNYTNMDGEDPTDPVTMEGFRILVGPRYSTIEDDKIVDGISVDKIWGLLSSWDSNGQLKDTCLSFSLFWLLLGKFYGYPLYKGRSKRKAWKLVHESLLGNRGEHERAFGVIEVELCFLYDYFYTKYFFFYLNGVWWKILYLLPFLFIAYFFQYFFVIYIPLLLEVIQIGVFICSRWFRVILVSYVAKEKGSKKRNILLSWWIEKLVVAISRISQCTGAVLGRRWKRQLDQYSLLESCDSFGMDNNGWLQAVLGAGLRIPIPKPGRKSSSKVALSEHVKRAVVLSLHSTGPRLSNGVASLMRNKVDNELSWACELSKDAEVLLVWHIATSICEMSPTSQQHTTQSLVDFNVATNLSKYCAYLLAFSPVLLSIPLHEADLTCDTTIRGARTLLNKCSILCFKTAETNKYEKLMEWLHGEEGTGNSTKVLQSGLKLGEQLLTIVEDEERRWMILAELWAEMILFLAPSNSNELVHAEKLADGGEFITLLWALLIHAGVVDRQELIRMPHTNDEVGPYRSDNV